MKYQEHEFVAPRIRMDRVACHCNDHTCSGKHLDPQIRPRTQRMLTLAGELLQRYELLYDHSYRISSCQRCEAHNRKQGGSANSAHLHNVAIDIATNGPVMDLVILAEEQCVWSQITWCKETHQIHLDLAPDDKVRRGHKDAAGVYRVRVIGERYGSPLKPVHEWNLDEDTDCPAYISGYYQRSGTDGV